jgi:hypothetical protein
MPPAWAGIGVDVVGTIQFSTPDVISAQSASFTGK